MTTGLSPNQLLVLQRLAAVSATLQPTVVRIDFSTFVIEPTAPVLAAIVYLPHQPDVRPSDIRPTHPLPPEYAASEIQVLFLQQPFEHITVRYFPHRAVAFPEDIRATRPEQL
ncbi:hypothetical protein AAVH_02745 [Aphelenchoides avenae]|nr:hypothetical protein AAVH_02745 [Aphelenchus avenae]